MATRGRQSVNNTCTTHPMRSPNPKPLDSPSRAPSTPLFCSNSQLKSIVKVTSSGIFTLSS